MDRKGIAAVTVAIIVMVWWTFQNAKTTQALAEKQAAEARTAEIAKSNAAVADAAANPVAPATADPSATTATSAGTPALAAVPEEIDPLDSPSSQFTFTNIGGGIQRIKLKAHHAEHGSNVELNHFGTIPIGAISEGSAGGALVPFTRVADTKTGEIAFEANDARQLQTTKRFVLPQATDLRSEYLTTMEVTFTNKATTPLPIGTYYVYTGAAAPIHRLDLPQYTGVAWYPSGKFTFKGAATFNSSGILGFGKKSEQTFTENREHTRWAGVTNQYFTSLVTPIDAEGNGVWARPFPVDRALLGSGGEHIPATAAASTASKEHSEAIDGALAMPGFTLAPGESKTVKFELYNGPREYHRLKSLGRNEDEIMEFGMFKIVSKILLNTMNWLHSKVGSYAIAIIILTIIIRGLMWPLQNKATQSMKKMQALQPKMTELKEKYKDDPQRQQQELMKLYKDYQINPAAGCLPMIVQIPVFFGFYSMLGKAVELRNARFLWVDDLSQMDTVAWLPFLDQPLNVLPLCMAVTMLWQMSLSPKTGDPVQQRVFMFMPLIFVFFCYKYASALALYWTVQNLFSVAQLYITRNQTAPVLQKISAPSKKR